MPVRKKDQQIRSVTIDKHGGFSQYKVLKGDLWVSGYDERAGDDVQEMKLLPGKYRVSFYPSGEASGSDAIVYLKVEKLHKGKYVRVK